MWPLLKCLQHQFAENGVRPSEPGAGEFLRIVLVKGFVHEARPRVRLLQCLQATANFLVVGAGQAARDNAQGPNHVYADVRAAGPFGGAAFAEIGIPRR